MKIDIFGVPESLGTKNGPKMDFERCEVREDRFGDPFCPPSWAPSWSQNAIKIHLEVGQNFDPVSGRILERLGLDFGGVLGAEIESERKLKIRSTRLGGSSIFEVPGGSKIE